MADADMELDLAPQTGSGEQIDEDLIDYDDEDLAVADGDTDQDMSMYLDKLENVNDSHGGDDADGMEILDYQEHDTVIADSDQHAVANPHTARQQAHETYVSDEQHDTPEIEIPDRTEGDDTGQAKDGGSSAEGQPVTADDKATEEITYEDDSEAVGNAISHHDDTHAPEGSSLANNTGNQPETDEITWEDEQEGDKNEESRDNLEQQDADDEKKVTDPGISRSTRKAEGDYKPDQTQLEGSQPEGESFEKVKDGDAESQNEDSVERLDANNQDTGSEAAADGHVHADSKSHSADSQGVYRDYTYPSITVHYRGEDFPLISTNEEDGFFGSQSVLDWSFEDLLENLRLELDEETGPDHYLVLQIDELGLEISELSRDEIFAACSLRQVLEVYELLVQNQDPDGSSDLYIYLRTRSYPSKRYEYLVECATEGKGLDEIIYLFAPSETAALSHPAIANATEDEEYSENTNDVEPHYHVADRVNSAQNTETGLLGRAEHSQPDVEYHEEESFDDLEADEEVEAVTGTEHHVQANTDKDGTDENADNLRDPDIADTRDAADIEDGKEVAEAEAEEADELDFGLGVDSTDNHASDPPTETRPPGILSPEATSEVNDGEELGGDDIPEEDPPEGAISVVDFAPQVTSSSNSHTIQEGSEGDATPPQSNGRGNEHAIGHDPEADEDELAEIDWRDEPEVAEVVETAQYTGEKRGREDESVAADTEQDVKRRRS